MYYLLTVDFKYVIISSLQDIVRIQKCVSAFLGKFKIKLNPKFQVLKSKLCFQLQVKFRDLR